MFAEAAGWSRPIRFAGGAGGHAVKRLVFAHIGRSTIRALDRGEQFPLGVRRSRFASLR